MPSLNAEKKEDKSFSYDALPYEGFAYAQTHPAHLYSVASLFGLNPPDFKKARVLELGCGGGDNLLPLALTYPKSIFPKIISMTPIGKLTNSALAMPFFCNRM